MTLISEFNLRFFANNAIPDYVVMVEGDTAEGTSRSDPRVLPGRTSRGQAHKTLILEGSIGWRQDHVPGSPACEQGEGAFRLMRTDCRDEIPLRARRPAPQKVGVVETGKLGGNLATEQITEYKNSIVTPGQGRPEHRADRNHRAWIWGQRPELRL